MRIAVMGASGVLLLAATADQADAQRRAWRRNQNRFYPMSYNACCPQPIYSQDCCPGEFATTGFGSSGYASSPYHYSDPQSQQPTLAPQYAQPGQSRSIYNDQPADAPMREGAHAQRGTGQPPQIAQGQSGPQHRMAMRPNFEESPEFQRMQEEIDSLKQEVSELRQEIDQLQSRRAMPKTPPAVPREPAEASGPEIPRGGEPTPGNPPVDNR
jgi:hypothetical protein